MSDLAPSTLTVNLDAYAHNLHAIQARLGEECRTMAVVKANGYGLGAIPLAKRAAREGVAMLGVATVQEGASLREAGVNTPILVLVQPQKEALATAVQFDLRLTVSDVQTAESFGECAHKSKAIGVVHCKIDTGMGRQGFPAEEALRSVLKVTRISNVDIEGLCTHLGSADVQKDPYTEEQIKTFRQLRRKMAEEGVPYEIVHAANSAAILNYPNCHFDMVRTGLMSYGVRPTEAPAVDLDLRPTVEWTSKIALLRSFAGGAAIGYGRTYRTTEPIKGAIVPVGYADGYLHSLSNRGEVLVGGTRCKVCGAVSMDQIVVDVSNVPNPAVGDSVVLIGGQNDESISVEEIAAKAQTIPYEILAGIGNRVERRYIGDDQ